MPFRTNKRIWGFMLNRAPGSVAVSYESFYCIPSYSQRKESIGEGSLPVKLTAWFSTAPVGLEAPSFSREKFQKLLVLNFCLLPLRWFVVTSCCITQTVSLLAWNFPEKGSDRWRSFSRQPGSILRSCSLLSSQLRVDGFNICQKVDRKYYASKHDWIWDSKCSYLSR